MQSEDLPWKARLDLPGVLMQSETPGGKDGTVSPLHNLWN